jgi:hypothetical protein
VSALADAAALGFADHNPAVVMAAVNEVLPLGKNEALDAIEAAAEGDAIGLFWVLRSLFDMPPDPGFPPVRWGKPDVPPPADPATLPRFPLVLAADVPLLAVHGYALGGLPEPVSAQIIDYREFGELRDGPMELPEDLGVVESDFLAQWHRAYGDDEDALARELVSAQLARVR